MSDVVFDYSTVQPRSLNDLMCYSVCARLDHNESLMNGTQALGALYER